MFCFVAIVNLQLKKFCILHVYIKYDIWSWLKQQFNFASVFVFYYRASVSPKPTSQWIMKSIYKILGISRPSQSHGQVNAVDLSFIVANYYPPHNTDQIVLVI